MRRASVFLVFAAVTACASAGPKPSLQLEFRGFSRVTHMAWFGVLEARYGCDTVIVKMSGRPGPGVGVGVCDVARYVQPEVVRVWADSTGIREVWQYRSGAGGPGYRGAPVWGNQGDHSCLELAGLRPLDLRVTRLAC